MEKTLSQRFREMRQDLRGAARILKDARTRTPRAMSGTGRTAMRLIRLLDVAGFRVESQELYPTRGYWLHRHQDCYRWEAVAVRKDDGQTFRLYSWQTMTACVRAGVVTVDGDGGVFPGKHEPMPRGPSRMRG